MTAEQKIRLAQQLWWEARKLKAAGLRSQHPNWTEEQIEAKVREIFLYAQS